MSIQSITITLPDGSARTYAAGSTGADVAASIGAGLAKAALAIRLDGQLKDLKTPLVRDARIEIVTLKDKNEAEVLELIRHDGAHVLAQAVQELFPGTQITFGPATDEGFYYDFVRDEPFTPEDFTRIEARMKEIVQRDLSIDREEWPADKAVEYFKSIGETYKAEWVAELAGRGEPISIYRQGDRWLDLCMGPHLPSTGKLPTAFKLMKVSGAYWRGDAKNRQLQRVYATGWRDARELDAYLTRLEEAEKRDHRKLARQLDLFHQQEEAPGMVFWHPKGWAIWQAVEQYVRDVCRRNGYAEVRGPQILDVSLWKKSGHWDNYKDNMFFTESEKRTYAVKPMNCPGHVQIYNAGLRSYRDLPIRYAEFGSCHRNEPSGALHGIMRVRAFTQDDGHVFCAPEQVEGEVTAFHQQAMQVYADFGFTDIAVKLALRPDKRLGTDEFWDLAEETLRRALRTAGVAWEELPGEGAFYAPKIEYHLKDSIGRSWQVGTLQLDYMMPERLGAHYIDEHSNRQMPAMLHRAIVGSMERFIGILLEHHSGKLPAWLAPVQAVVLSITDRQAEYAQQACETLQNQGFRVETDLRNEKVGFKIREHTLQRVPYLLVAGDREVETNALAVRSRNGKDLGAVSLEVIASRLAEEVASRGRIVWED